MELPLRLRNGIDRLAERYGPRADEPVVAAKLVGSSAAVFSLLYYGNLATGHMGEYAQGDYSALILSTQFFCLTVTNAVVVTWVVWKLLGFSGVWRYRYGAAGGLLVALVWHLTLGYGIVALGAVTGYSETTLNSLSQAVFLAITIGLSSIPFSLSIPLVLSIGIALALTYTRKRTIAQAPADV